MTHWGVTKQNNRSVHISAKIFFNVYLGKKVLGVSKLTASFIFKWTVPLSRLCANKHAELWTAAVIQSLAESWECWWWLIENCRVRARAGRIWMMWIIEYLGDDSRADGSSEETEVRYKSLPLSVERVCIWGCHGNLCYVLCLLREELPSLSQNKHFLPVNSRESECRTHAFPVRTLHFSFTHTHPSY